MNKITILGGGSWGTAIARLLANKHGDATLYILEKPQAAYVQKYRENPHFLPGVKLSEALKITDSIKEAVKDAKYVVLGVPTSASRSVMEEIKDLLEKDAIVINLAKGIEVGTLKRISEIAEELIPNHSFVSLSGPSHAEEVGRDIPTAVTVSSKDEDAAKEIQDLFSTENFRVYTQKDLIGVEIGGALKNIIALAAGLSDGLGYGDNTKAALMTRGMYEMSKLGICLGAAPQTFHGLAGMGDLIVTCTSMHSRNRRCGILLGQGKSIDEAIEEVGMVVEGIKTTKSAYHLAQKYQVEMPITEKLYDVLYHRQDPKKAVLSLMTRKKKEEIEEIFYENEKK
ncbi:MAG: NAD(P)H-dependent glycerol-3-phosphate dehydrogenase [Tissierellia bacterium]|nr:NAD(P)H-dependent glycerol-3-phosphate dehydrogenase [Tissierellia bacterium]